MSKLNNKNASFYISGDFNLNALKYDDPAFANVKSFIDMMFSNSTMNFIKEVTICRYGSDK